MYAVIKTGGKQQRVKPGDVIEVERLVHEGETISFQPLLVVDDDGATHVGKAAAGAVVTAKPLGEKKGEKIRVLRYRPKTGYSQTHRASPAAHPARDLRHRAREFGEASIGQGRRAGDGRSRRDRSRRDRVSRDRSRRQRVSARLIA